MNIKITFNEHHDLAFHMEKKDLVAFFEALNEYKVVKLSNDVWINSNNIRVIEIREDDKI